MQLLLPIFLLLSLATFLFKIFLAYVKTVRVLLFSGLIVGGMLCLLLITILSLPRQESDFQLHSVSRGNISQFKYTESEFYALLQKYSYLMRVQPTHRDILLNASLLYSSQDNVAKSQELFIAAKRVDPNNQLFQE